MVEDSGGTHKTVVENPVLAHKSMVEDSGGAHKTMVENTFLARQIYGRRQWRGAHNYGRRQWRDAQLW